MNSSYLLCRRKRGSGCQEGSKDGDLHGHVEFVWSIVVVVVVLFCSSVERAVVAQDTQTQRRLTDSLLKILDREMFAAFDGLIPSTRPP
jgi:hypothetical protein